MQKIIISLCLLHFAITIAMDAPNRRRSSSGRTNTLLARHQRHGSLGDKVFASLTLKTDETRDCSGNLDALITQRRSPIQTLALESSKSTDCLASSASRNFTTLAAEKNKDNFVKMTQLAFVAIKNIKAVNDDTHKECLSHMKYARHYFRSWISLTVTKEHSSLESLENEEFKPLQDAFDKKMALIASGKSA